MPLNKVVVIGGGNGSAISICALKPYASDIDISAVISMSDSGGSSGRLRREINTLPPGDIMRAVLAMSKYDYKTLRSIFYRPRFVGLGKLNKHNLSNLFIVLTAKYSGSYIRTIRAFEQSVETVGTVYPVTLGKAEMVVKLTNKKTVFSDQKIGHPHYNRKEKIVKMWLEPKVNIYTPAKKTIEQADYIIFGPGSLYTSLIATLAVNGVSQAIKKSKAKLIFIASAFHRHGETGPESLSGMINDLEKYLPRRLDYIIYNTTKLNKHQQAKYQSEDWALPALDVENLSDRNLVGAQFEAEEGGLDSLKLGKIIRKIMT